MFSHIEGNLVFSILENENALYCIKLAGWLASWLNPTSSLSPTGRHPCFIFGVVLSVIRLKSATPLIGIFFHYRLQSIYQHSKSQRARFKEYLAPWDLAPWALDCQRQLRTCHNVLYLRLRRRCAAQS